MNKKFICPICGYVHEGTEAPERCPQCKQIVEWKVADESKGLTWACEHVLGVAKNEQDYEEAEHASKFAELLGEVVWDTKTNLEKRMLAEAGACEDKLAIAKRAKELNLDPIHDTVHEMARDEARHGAGFQGLYNRYFKK